MCSVLLNYIETEIPNTVKKLILFSDGPSGQNKNHTVVRFFMNFCDKGRFDSIIHNFPVRGHSYSPCDRDFGAINRLFKKVDRMYTPEEYMELILEASKTNRFTAHKVTLHIISLKNGGLNHTKCLLTQTKPLVEVFLKTKRRVSRYRHTNSFITTRTLTGKVIVNPHIDGIILSTFTLLKIDPAPDLPTEMAYPSGKVSL